MEQHRRLNCTCNVLFTLVRLEANMTKYLLLSILGGRRQLLGRHAITQSKNKDYFLRTGLVGTWE